MVIGIVGAGPAFHFANLERLRNIPHARRQQLQLNLKKYDDLPPEQRQAISQLDSSLSELSDVDRQRLTGLMRRYHVWLQSQSGPTREQIETLELAQRLLLVEKLRKDERELREQSRSKAAGFYDMLQLSTLVTESLRVSAIETRLWYQLQPEDRKSVLASPMARQQRQRLQEIVEKEPTLSEMRQALTKELGLDLTELREAARRIDRGKGNAMGKNGLGNQFLKRKIEYERFVRNPARDPITARNLERFEESMPPWIRESFDALPPDAAVARLRLLYRLVFPAPEELPEPKPQQKSRSNQSPTVDPNARPF